jgi:Spy/CpxP family protein refolding chaperone
VSFRNWIVGVGALALASSVVVFAQDAKPDADTPAPAVRTRLPRDYVQMTDLTDDQKDKLLSIREDADKQMEAIRAKEADDMKALLSDDQKKELDAIDAKIKEDTRAAREKARLQERVQEDTQKLNQDSGTPTTNPTN